MLVTSGWAACTARYRTQSSSSSQSRIYERDFGRPLCCDFETPLLKRDFITIGAAEISILSTSGILGTNLDSKNMIMLDFTQGPG